MNMCADCLDMFVPLRTLLANFLERRACEPRAERTSEDFQFPIMSCMHTWEGMRQHDQGDSTIRDLILDSGNAVLRESRPWKWARRERHAALAATFTPQENFQGTQSAGKHVAWKAHCTALAGDH